MDRLADLHDLSEVQALREDDLRAAVEDLRRSTAAVNKQTETLRHQRDAFSQLVAKRADGEARRLELETARQRKFESERVRISSEVRHWSSHQPPLSLLPRDKFACQANAQKRGRGTPFCRICALTSYFESSSQKSHMVSTFASRSSSRTMTPRQPRWTRPLTSYCSPMMNS